MTSTQAPRPTNTTAFFVQAVVAFAIALGTVTVGQLYLPVPAWTRAFLALGTVFLVSSTFTLAKCVRDAQEAGTVVSRLDQARVERLLAEFDPYRRDEHTGAGVPAGPGAAVGPTPHGDVPLDLGHPAPTGFARA